MKRSRSYIVLAAMLLAAMLLLTACSTVGGLVEGVGSLFDKTGQTIKKL